VRSSHGVNGSPTAYSTTIQVPSAVVGSRNLHQHGEINARPFWELVMGLANWARLADWVVYRRGTEPIPLSFFSFAPSPYASNTITSWNHRLTGRFPTNAHPICPLPRPIPMSHDRNSCLSPLSSPFHFIDSTSTSKHRYLQKEPRWTGNQRTIFPSQR